MRHRRITASQVVLIRRSTTQLQVTTQRARRAHTVNVSRTSTEARTSSDLSSPMSVSTRLGQPSATIFAAPRRTATNPRRRRNVHTMSSGRRVTDDKRCANTRHNMVHRGSSRRPDASCLLARAPDEDQTVAISAQIQKLHTHTRRKCVGATARSSAIEGLDDDALAAG